MRFFIVNTILNSGHQTGIVIFNNNIKTHSIKNNIHHAHVKLF